MIETIRPTMSMVRDLLPGMKESWIFNDCAIGETRYGEFVGLVVVRIDDGDTFYGYTEIRPDASRRTTIDTLDITAEIFDYCPDVFDKKVTWTNIKEGHRYARYRPGGRLPRSLSDLRQCEWKQGLRQIYGWGGASLPHLYTLCVDELQRLHSGQHQGRQGMNRINQMIDNHATTAADCFHRAVLLGHDGFFEESAGMTHRMLEAREQLKMWMKISQAVRGWKL